MNLKKRWRPACIAALMTGVAVLQSAATPAAAGGRQPNNPLIGKWHFIGFGKGPTTSPSGCSIDMTFTPTQWIQSQGGTKSNVRVTYIPSAKMVYVVDPDGGHVTYILVDASHIALNSFAPCTYARVS